MQNANFLLSVVALGGCILSSVLAAEPPFEWLQTMPGRGRAIAADSMTNIYFSGSHLTTSGDAFLVKLSRDGKIAWTKIEMTADAYAVAVDTDASVYAAGTRNEAAGIETPVSAFVSHFDRAGNLLWNDEITSEAGSAYCTGITLDEEGSVYVIGRFNALLKFGDLSLRSEGDPAFGRSNIFVGKYSRDGKHLWVRSAGGSGRPSPNGIVYDQTSSSVAIYGTLDDLGIFGGVYTALFDGIPLKIWSRSAFWARLSKDGAYLAAHATANAWAGLATSGLAVLAGEIYVTGQVLSGSRDVEGTRAPERSIFLSKYGLLGEPRWLRSAAGNSGNDYGLAVRADSAKKIYTTGRFFRTAEFGTNTLVAHNLAGISGYLATWSPTGELLRVDQLDDDPTSWTFSPEALCVGPDDTPYLGGDTIRSVTGSRVGVAWVGKYKRPPYPRFEVTTNDQFVFIGSSDQPFSIEFSGDMVSWSLVTNSPTLEIPIPIEIPRNAPRGFLRAIQIDKP